MRHQDKKFVDVFALLDAAARFNGQQVNETDCPPGFPENETLGQAGALYKILGPDAIAALRRKDVALVLDAEANAVILKHIEKPLMDEDGRFLFTERFETCCTEASEALEVSSMGAPAVTSTVSSTAPTCSLASTAAVPVDRTTTWS